MLPVCHTLMPSSLNRQKQAHPTAGSGTRGPGTAGPAQGATLPSCKSALLAPVQGARPYLTAQCPITMFSTRSQSAPSIGRAQRLMAKAGPSWGMPCDICNAPRWESATWVRG